METADNNRLAKYISRHFKKGDFLKQLIVIETLRERLKNKEYPDKCLLNLNFEEIFAVLTNEMIEKFKLNEWIKFLFHWLGFKGQKRESMLGMILRNLPYKNMTISFIKEHILQSKKVQNNPDHKRLLYTIICIKLNSKILDHQRFELLSKDLKEAYELAQKSKYTNFFEKELNIKHLYTVQEYENEKKIVNDHFLASQSNANKQKDESKEKMLEIRKNISLKYEIEKFFVFPDVLESNQRVKNFAFNPYDKKISNISFINNLRRGSASLIIDKKIFIINGFENNNSKSIYTDYVCYYDLTKNMWEQNIFSTQTVRRYNSTMVKIPNNDYQAFQIGGVCPDNESAIDIKLYDFQKLSISTSYDITNSSLYNIQNGISVDKSYYLFEHQSKYNKKSKIVRWDPRESFKDATIDELSYIDSLKPNYTLATFQNCIFILGGQNKEGFALNDVVIFDVRNLKTQNINPMSYKRYNHNCFIYKNNLYVLGGNVNDGKNDTVIDILNIYTFEWSISGTKIPFPLNSFTGVYYS